MEENNDQKDIDEIFNKKPETSKLAASVVPEKTPEPVKETAANIIKPQEKPPIPEVEPSVEKNSDENKEEVGQSKFITLILDLALNLLIVFGLVYIIQTFIASPFKVFGPSMCDTLNYLNEECQQGYGEYIIVNKLVYKDFFGWSLSEPDRGDIIVFHPPHTNEQFYIKRVIGLPGDTIKLISGKVFLFNEQYETGYELPEEYLNEINSSNTKPSTNRVTTFEVPEGEYFVMGDNRRASTDSRSCFRDAFQGGCRGEDAYFLPEQNIAGRAWVVLWPLDHMRVIPHADYF